MDVLEFTEDELRKLSTDELRVLHDEAKAKESFYNTSQLVQKVLINSVYGALGNQYFPLYNAQIAGAITSNGRYFIRKLANYVNEALQKLIPQDESYVVAGDTDSIYFTIAAFMDKYQTKNPGLGINEYVDWADNFEKKIIQPVIQKCIQDFSDELNAYNTDVIGATREAIADAAVFADKKRYYARIRDDEGTRFPEDSPKIKVMGLEIAKSSTPKWSKKHLKEAIPSILDKTESELKDWLNELRKEYVNAPLNDIAHVSGISSLDYVLGEKSIPIGSRAGLVYNKYIQENNLTDRYTLIQPGNKYKLLFLIEPNPFNSNIIAYANDSFVKELEGYVDYDTNFEKQFLKPLDLMIGALNWDIYKQTESLDDW